MDANKMISVLGGMIYASDNEPKTKDWVKEFLVEIKELLEEQQKENELLKRKTKLLEDGICSNSCLGTDIENELKQLDKEIAELTLIQQ